MKIELIRWPTDEDKVMCKRCALETMGKSPVSAPTDQWLHDICNARHSPIRELRFAFELTDLPYYVSVHLCRHVHAQPYVQSQRNDRQDKYDRTKAPQDAPVRMIWTMSAEELMVIANKRLCAKAALETRLVVAEMCKLVEDKCPWMRGLLVPMCEYQGGVCHEMQPCGRCVKG